MSATRAIRFLHTAPHTAARPRATSPGRPTILQQYGLSESDLTAIRQTALTLDLGSDRVSHSLAVRLWADKALPPEHPFRVWLAGRCSKHHLPQSLLDAIRVPREVVATYRSPKRAALEYGAHCPGTLRPLRAGERQSWDDASINAVLWTVIDGKVECGRFQLLMGVDDATDYVVGFALVARLRDAYRGEDAIGRAMLPTWRAQGMPQQVILERGIWESNRMLEALEALGMERITSYHPRSKRIEAILHMLWTRLGHLKGYVGRDRRVKDEAGDKLLRQCRAGTMDPCERFLSLPQMIAEIQAAIEALNAEIRESKRYGRWSPAERWAAEAPQRLRPVPELGWVLHPERRILTVRQGGMLMAQVKTEWGWSVPYDFGSSDLLFHVGRKVAVYFDPWSDDCCATVVNPETNQVLAERCELLSGNADAGRELRKANRQVVRSELRVLAPGGKVAAWRSEARGSDGVSAMLEMSRSDGRAVEAPTAPDPLEAPARGGRNGETIPFPAPDRDRRGGDTERLLARLGDRDAVLNEYDF